MDEEVVAELIQEKFNYKNVKKELSKLLETVHQNKILSKYDELEAKLGGIGASEKTAKLILNYLK